MTTDPFDSRPAIVKMPESLDDPVGPECDEETNEIEIRSAIVKTPESLDVPEEPENDDETSFRYDVRSNLDRTASEVSTKSITFSSVITAINVAKWMARAYGYSSHNKSLFVSQEKVCSIFVCSHDFPCYHF